MSSGSAQVRAFSLLLALTALLGHQAALAQSPSLGANQPTPSSQDRWTWGAVADITATSKPLALGARDRGIQLGHSDVVFSGPVGSHLRAQLGVVFETHDRKLEAELEEAWIETRRLPFGLQARAGRFASQIGYLNQQHQHADDFVERPPLYRAFLGGHLNDDGLRLNWTAPTPFYLQLGVEGFRGKRLVEEAANRVSGLGVATFNVKTGMDLSRSHSFQVGLSYLRNRREAVAEDHGHGHSHNHSHDHDHEHSHSHGAAFTGKNTWMIDGTWKWAPDGNSRQNQVRVNFEAARVQQLNRYATKRDQHEASSFAVIWRFHPAWEVGARTDWLRVRIPHDDHFHNGRLQEQAIMLAWKPTHMQSLRFQLTSQNQVKGFDNPSKRTIQIQYVLGFGAHAAHAY